MQKLSFIKAEAKHCLDILSLIKDLAIYEKLEHEVTATPELLNEHLFGENPRAHSVLLYDDEVLVGFALYYFNFSTFLAKPGLYLEDLYVKERHRGKGYGKALLIHLAQIAKQKDCGRMEWTVLDWNDPAINFYDSIGAESMDGWTIRRLTGEKLNGFN